MERASQVAIVVKNLPTNSGDVRDISSSHEIKRRLLFGRKAMTKPRQRIQKQRHYFANKGTKVHIVKAMIFPVVMYGY